MDLSLHKRPACYFRWRLSPKPARSDAQRGARISAVRTPALPTMSEQRVRDRRRIGRPPAGAREGEKVKDYPQLSIRLTADIKAKLQALSLINSRPQWRLISDAVECYLRDRSEDEQALVRDLIGRSRSRGR